MARRLFWLKMPGDFFSRKEIKLLRKMPGGDTLVLVYERLLLLSLKTGGVLTFEGYGNDPAEEWALELDVAQDTADTAAQPATGDEREPVLMPVLMPGA